MDEIRVQRLCDVRLLIVDERQVKLYGFGAIFQRSVERTGKDESITLPRGKALRDQWSNRPCAIRLGGQAPDGLERVTRKLCEDVRKLGEEMLLLVVTRVFEIQGVSAKLVHENVTDSDVVSPALYSEVMHSRDWNLGGPKKLQSRNLAVENCVLQLLRGGGRVGAADATDPFFAVDEGDRYVVVHAAHDVVKIVRVARYDRGRASYTTSEGGGAGAQSLDVHSLDEAIDLVARSCGIRVTPRVCLFFDLYVYKELS